MKNNNNSDLSPLTDIVEATASIITNLLQLISKKAWKLWEKYVLKKVSLESLKFHLLRNKKLATLPTSLGYSINNKKELLFSEVSFDKHSFVVGAAGFGKTNLLSLLQEHDLQVARPIIFIDPKGDLEALMTFKKLCEKYQRTALIFSEYYPHSVKINPLKNGSTNQIVDRIIDSFDWSSEHYRDLAQVCLTNIIKELKALNKQVSFKNIFDLLVCYKSIKPDDLIGLRSKIESIVYSDFGKLLEDEGNTLDLRTIRKDKLCLYIGLSTQGYGKTARALGKIFVSDLKFQSYLQLSATANSHESMKNAISIYFDEAGSLITPEFIELQNKCRAAGLRLTLACQSIADIDAVSPELTKQVIENAANVFIFKQMVEQSSTFLAKSIGTVTTVKHTYQTEGDEKSEKGSMREVNELIVHPDLLKSLRVGQCILVRYNPLQVDLLNVREQERAKDEATPEPIIKSQPEGKVCQSLLS